jgi:acyl carrier protein
MDQTEARLQKCFSTVFPELTAAEIPHATAATVARWDSLSGITLIALINEEFAIDLDMEDFESLTSYKGLLEQIRVS